MVRALGGLTIGAVCALTNCSPFSGSDHAAPAGDAGRSDAGAVVGADAAPSGPFCMQSAHKLCMDFDDNILAPPPFSARGDGQYLSVVDDGPGKALFIDALAAADASGRVADLVATVPVPAKVTFGFTLTLVGSETQPDHVEIAGFEIQNQSLPFVWVIIEGKNFVVVDGTSSNMMDTLYTAALPPPGNPMQLEVAFNLGSVTSVVVKQDGNVVTVSKPTMLASLVVDPQQRVACSAGMHYRYTPAAAARYQLDNVYFDF